MAITDVEDDREDDVTEPSEYGLEGSLLEDMDYQENRRLASYWRAEIKGVDEAARKWVKRCETIVRRYRDERNRIDEEGQRRMNILWSTVQTLHPALYGKMPLAIAERKFLDRDPIGRIASQMLQRCLRNEMDISEYDESVASAVLDYLLCARGQCWVRYEPTIGEGVSLPASGADDMRDDEGEIGDEDDEDDKTEKLEETGMEVLGESIPVDYVNWKDFYMFPARARRWSEVQAVGKRVYMSRDEMKRRFGQKIGYKVSLSFSMKDRAAMGEVTAMHDLQERKAEVFEIWNKDDRRVYWVAEGFDELCDAREDPLELRKFFPCPRPLTGTATNETLIPVPDYLEWQDQAIMVDELTQRISMLSKACKVAGVYAAAEFAVRRLLDESVENELIPVDDWAAFAEKGGVKGVISLLPLQEVIACIDKLIIVRTETLRNLDQVTGISDIMRGTSDARETMGGMRLKSNYSTIRLTKRQKEVARFCRDIIMLMAEIASTKFSEETLIESSGAIFEEGVGAELSDMVTSQQNPNQPLLPPPSPAAGAPPGQPPMGMPPPGGLPPMGGPPPPGLPSPGQPPPGAPPGPPMGGQVLPMPPRPPVAPGTTPAAMPGGGNVVPFPGAPGPGGPMPPAPPGPPPPMGGLPMLPPPNPMRYTPPVIRGAPPPGMISNLSRMFGAPPPIAPGQNPPGMDVLVKIAKAILLLRHDRRGFRIDIETDSTIQEEAQDDKEATVEFVKALTMFMQQAGPILLTAPEAAPMLGKLLAFSVRKFRTGRDLESVIDEFVDSMQKKTKLMASQPKPPSPEELKMQREQMSAQAEVQTANINAQGKQQDAAMKEKSSAIDMQMKQYDAQSQREQLDQKGKIAQQEFMMKMQQMEREGQFREAEHNMRMRELALKGQTQVQSHVIDQQEAAQDHARSQEQHAMSMAEGQQSHAFTQAEGQQSHAIAQQAGEQKQREVAQKAALNNQKPSASPGGPPKTSTPSPAPPPPTPAPSSHPPVRGARQAPDGHHYLPDPNRAGKYLRVRAT